MMYNFFFTSLGRAYIAHLDKPEKNSHIDILCVNSTSRSKLMEWDSVAYISTTDSIGKDVKNAVLKEVSQSTNKVTLIFSDSKNVGTSQSYKDQEEAVIVITNKKNSHISFKSTDSSYVDILDVVLKFKDYESTISFHCVPLNDLYNVVLDFGSEASQMLISKNNPDSAIVPEKVFANTLSHFYNIQRVKGDRVYDQQDEDEKLFRSVFYLKKNAKMSDSFEYDRPSRDDSFFSFMSKRTESHEGRIPNIKIAYLTGAIVNEVNDMQTLHRGIVSRFLHEAIYRISEIHKNKTNKVGIYFTVLLPNVMPQNAVSSFLDNMRRVANSSEFIEANGSPLQIECINVSSCSESDASFLECLHQAALPGSQNKMKVMPGKRYLIIDIGKGTTDFSLVKLSSATSAISEYRAGFVGAGNAISYAVFSDYMKTIAGNKAQTLEKKMLKAEPAVLFELENKIEDAKKNWSKGKDATTFAPISTVDNITTEAILDKIDELGVINDSQGKVAEMLNQISERIVDQIPLDGVDYVVFSGRSFKFVKLKEQLESHLRKKIGKNVEVFFNSETAKNGCLFGPLRKISMSLESQMVGFPLIVDITKVKQTEPNGGETSNGSAIPVINADTLKLEKINSTKQILAKGVKFLTELFGDDNQTQSANSLKSASTNFDSEVKTYMTKGREIKNIGGNSRIIISGNVYTTEDQYPLSNADAPYSLYFDGEDFYLKHESGCHKLVMQVNRGTQKLLKESLFPYSLTLKD